MDGSMAGRYAVLSRSMRMQGSELSKVFGGMPTPTAHYALMLYAENECLRQRLRRLEGSVRCEERLPGGPVPAISLQNALGEPGCADHPPGLPTLLSRISQRNVLVEVASEQIKAVAPPCSMDPVRVEGDFSCVFPLIGCDCSGTTTAESPQTDRRANARETEQPDYVAARCIDSEVAGVAAQDRQVAIEIRDGRVDEVQAKLSLRTSVLTWRIFGLHAKLRVNNGFPLLSPPFDMEGFVGFRLMFAPGLIWTSFAGVRAMRKARRRHSKKHGKNCGTDIADPNGSSEYGAVKLKSGTGNPDAGSLRFRLQIGKVHHPDTIYCDFNENAVQGCDLGIDWRSVLESDGDTLVISLTVF